MTPPNFFTKTKRLVSPVTIKVMDEEEYVEYLNQIERLTAELGEPMLLERLYGDDGSVPGCYRTLPAPTEE